MAIKTYKPTTSSRRGLVLTDKSELWSGKPEKSLLRPKRAARGRNNLGRITNRVKGGGAKQRYRIIDFKRNKVDMFAIVERVEYDPNRTAYIALVKYEDGEISYIIAPDGMKTGDRVMSSNKGIEQSPGNTMPLSYIQVGATVHNIELKPGGGAQIARSAGACAQVMSKDGDYVSVRLRSGEVRLIRSSCKATIGVVSNPDEQNKVYAKAGRMRWLGIRPIVRGVARNPVDHPLGGGEGKTSGGRHPVSLWGKPAKGKKTRTNKRTNRFIVKSRSKSRG